MSQERFAYQRTASDRCGVTLSASVEGNIIADVMGQKEGVEVTKFPAMIRVDGTRMLEFDMDEIADALGEDEFDTSDFEIYTSTHYGRMVRLDDKVLLFADPGDAAEYLGMEPPPSDEDEPTLPG